MISTTPPRGVDIILAEGVTATLVWAQPGWCVWQCTALGFDPMPPDDTQPFATLSEATDYLRHSYSASLLVQQAARPDANRTVAKR